MFTRYPRLIGVATLALGLAALLLTRHSLRHHGKLTLLECLACPALLVGGLSIALLGKPDSRIHGLSFMVALLAGACLYLGSIGLIDIPSNIMQLLKGPPL